MLNLLGEERGCQFLHFDTQEELRESIEMRTLHLMAQLSVPLVVMHKPTMQLIAQDDDGRILESWDLRFVAESSEWDFQSCMPMPTNIEDLAEWSNPSSCTEVQTHIPSIGQA